MSLDSSQLLGVPEVAGVQVSRLGTYTMTLTKTRVWVAGGTTAAGSLVWGRLLKNRVAREQELAATSDAPDFDTRGYLALTEDDLVLIKVKWGARLSLERVLATVPRHAVSSVELGKSGGPLFSLPLTITLDNGDRWLFEVPRVVRARGKQLVRELGAQPAAVPAGHGSR